MSSKIIALDVDLTVVDPLPKWISWFEAKTGTKFPQDKLRGHKLEKVMKQYMKTDENPLDFWNISDLYDDLEPIAESVKYYQEAVGLGYEVLFVTASMHGHMDSKTNFLNKHFPMNSGIIHTKFKQYVKMDILVDDNEHFINEVQIKQPDTKCFMVKTILNEDSFLYPPLTWEQISARSLCQL
jgi:5'(3')-deoxyribonucleotidase